MIMRHLLFICILIASLFGDSPSEGTMESEAIQNSPDTIEESAGEQEPFEGMTVQDQVTIELDEGDSFEIH